MEVSTALDQTFWFLKKFELLAWCFGCYLFLPMKKFDHPKLFVRYLHDADLTLFGQVHFGALDMYGGIFPTGTETQVNTELKHVKTIVQ